jgi:large subunit ribosomal protein L15
MELNNLKYTKGARGHKRKTYGRGFGSGIGKTGGKGTKGQKQRKSGHVRLGFEGGQTPIYRKVPKVGFNNYNFRKQYNIVTI